MSALSQKGAGSRVLTGQLAEIRPDGMAGAAWPGQVGRCVLNTDDPGQCGKTRHRIDRHIDTGATGNIIDNDGYIGRIVDFFIMPIQTFLSGFVIVRGDDQDRVSAAFTRALGQANGLGGRVRSGAGYNRNPPSGGLDTKANDALMFVMG